MIFLQPFSVAMEGVCKYCVENANLPGKDEEERLLDLLDSAVKLGHHECLETLIQSGADVMQTPWAILHAAKGNDKCLELLIKAGADVNDCWGNALLLASSFGHVTCVEMLLKAGALVNRPDDFGNTPLILAAEHGHHACARALLRTGAVVNIVNDEGFTALDKARTNRHVTCVQLLEEHIALMTPDGDSTHLF